MGCCGKTECNCKVQAGTGTTVTGAGTKDDPFIISAALNMAPATDSPFVVTIEGDGTQESPYEIRVAYSPSAILGDIPDVDVSDAEVDQVLAWDGSKWVPHDPSTAEVGSVQTDDSLTGDGSGGDPLAVRADGNRGITTAGTGPGAGGVALRDGYINQLVRRFADVAARNAADPAADVDDGTLSRIIGRNSFIDQWDDADSRWKTITTRFILEEDSDVQLELSGPYTDGDQITHIIKFVTGNVDADGTITILGTADLSGYSGVLYCGFQESSAVGALFAMKTYGDVNKITGVAHALDGSEDTLPNGTTIRGWADAWLYG